MRSILTRWLVPLYWLVALAGCGWNPYASAPLSLDNYDRRCTSVADCAPVFFEASGCCHSDCPNTAVRASDAAREAHDILRATCHGPVDCPMVTACPGGRIQCVAGTCELELPDASARGDSTPADARRRRGGLS